MNVWSKINKGDAIAGCLLLSLGLFIAVDTGLSASTAPAYAVVGPRAFPLFIAAALAVIGTVLIFNARHKTSEDCTEDPQANDHFATSWIAISLLIQLAVLPWIGWIPSALLLFCGVSRAFGSKAWHKDTLVGIALSVLTFVVFNHVLGLDLPIGRAMELLTQPPAGT